MTQRTTPETLVLADHAQFLIETAARAPSVHNSQPWRFRVGPSAIELSCDTRRQSERVLASLYTQPLENPLTRALIRDRLALPGHPQLLLQLGRARTTHPTARRSAAEMTDP